MAAGAGWGGGEDMLKNILLEGTDGLAEGWDGPDVSKRSIIEFMFDRCGGRDVAAAVLPPRISARRSVLFCEPFVPSPGVGVLPSPIRSRMGGRSRGELMMRMSRMPASIKMDMG